MHPSAREARYCKGDVAGERGDRAAHVQGLPRRGRGRCPWDGRRDEIAEIHDLGNRVLVLSMQRGRGKGSGTEVEARYAILDDVAGDVIIGVRMYGTVAEALEAAGLSE